MLVQEVDIAVIGGGLGGVSAALAALELGCTVALTEPTDWLGGQLTSQLVPSDEHLFIEHDGANASYRRFRAMLRAYYRRNYPLTDAARADEHLNPGAGWVSALCVEPRVAVAVIDELLAPHRGADRLSVYLRTTPRAVDGEGDHVRAVQLLSEHVGDLVLRAKYVIDATELGDLLDLGGVEHVSGRESQAQTGEPGALQTADPTDMQGVTWCFAVDHLQGEDHTIDKPAGYEHWLALRPAQLKEHPLLSFELHSGFTWFFEPNPDDDPLAIDLDHRNMRSNPELSSLWVYRRIAARRQFRSGFYASDITVVNWPMNDYFGGPLFGVPDAAAHWDAAKELSKSVLYWMQTDAPRPDGGTGWPGLRLRKDIAGTADGYAMHPYIRESRRIAAEYTIVEQDVSTAHRADGAKRYRDSVGVGHYFWIDRHHTTSPSPKPSTGLPHPFEIPLGALLPVRMRNLLPACKNIGTTQITNGCYRLHPVEWSIGEAAGTLAAYSLATGVPPIAVREDETRLDDFQRLLTNRGVQLHWPEPLRRWSMNDH